MRTCKYCGLEFAGDVHYRKVIGHVVNCKANPNLQKKIDDAHQKLKRKKIFEFSCIKCGVSYQIFTTEHQINKGDYRKHCSRKCANGHILSDESKRKISIANVGKKYHRIRKKHEDNVNANNSGKNQKSTFALECAVCHNEFETNVKRSTCSIECYHDLLSQIMIKRSIAGQIKSKSTRCIYEFRGKMIRCDSLMEYACLDWCEKNIDNIIEIERSKLSLEYIVCEKKHRYIPDFEIVTDTKRILVECKSSKMGVKMSEKWGNYIETSPLKEYALRQYGIEHGVDVIWFDARTFHREFYYSLMKKKLRIGRLTEWHLPLKENEFGVRISAGPQSIVGSIPTGFTQRFTEVVKSDSG